MGGRLNGGNLELVRAMLTFKKKYSGEAKNKSGGKNKNRGAMLPRWQRAWPKYCRTYLFRPVVLNQLWFVATF